MRQVPIGMIQPGSILASNVYNQGKIIFRKGQALSRKDIRVLRSFGIRTLPIEDEDEIQMRSTGMISEETRNQAVETVYDVLNDFEKLDPMKFERVRSSAGTIVDEILDIDDLRIPAHDLRTFDDYTYRHSVNVTAIATAIARIMDYDATDLRLLASGALMHDIGKMRIPEAILNKPSRLDDEERACIEQHPVWGFEMLSDSTKSDPLIWSIARQHHETLDGEGYPDKRWGSEIHPWARIVTVADLWDALRSDRPYKKGWSADKVLDFLNSPEIKPKLDPEVLRIMNEISVPYPIGCTVRLSNRLLAVIVQQNLEDPALPIVRLAREVDGKIESSADDEDVIMLKDHKEITIVETVA